MSKFKDKIVALLLTEKVHRGDLEDLKDSLLEKLKYFYNVLERSQPGIGNYWEPHVKKVISMIDKNETVKAIYTYMQVEMRFSFIDSWQLVLSLLQQEESKVDYSKWGRGPGTYIAWRIGKIKELKSGIFFAGEKKLAEEYSKPGINDGIVRKYKVTIRKPYIAKNLWEILRKYDLSKLHLMKSQRLSKERAWVLGDEMVAEVILKEGYDSILYTAPAGGDSPELCVFKASQVKEIK